MNKNETLNFEADSYEWSSEDWTYFTLFFYFFYNPSKNFIMDAAYYSFWFTHCYLNFSPKYLNPLKLDFSSRSIILPDQKNIYRSSECLTKDNQLVKQIKKSCNKL